MSNSDRSPLVARLVVVTCLGGATACLNTSPHTPARSPEPQSSCADARAAAYQAREELLGGPTVWRRHMAAQAVYEHAVCEADAFRRAKLDLRAAADLEHALGGVELQYESTATLYGELVNYDVARWTIASHAGNAALGAVFADKLRHAASQAMAPPGGGDAYGAAYLLRLAQFYDRHVAHYLILCLEAAAGVQSLWAHDESVRRWVSAACSQLTHLAPSAPALSTCRAALSVR